jgi:integrase
MRLLYGFLDREGCRIREVTTLDFRDVDLKHGEVHLDANKTDDPRSWALGGDVAEALRRWKDHFHPNPAAESRIFVYPETSREAGGEIDGAARAEEFRDNLKRAEVQRPQLYMHNETRRRIRIHDLRAPFVTIALAAGRSETWVSDRTGHRSSHQIKNYQRASRTHAELKLGTLAPLHEAIPELDAAVPRPVSGGTPGEQPSEGENQVHSESVMNSAERAGFESSGAR